MSGPDVPARPTSPAEGARAALWRTIHAYRAGKEFPGRVDDAIDALLAASPPLPQEQGAANSDTKRLDWLEATNQRGHYCGAFSGHLLTRASIDAAMTPVADPGQAQMGETK